MPDAIAPRVAEVAKTIKALTKADAIDPALAEATKDFWLIPKTDTISIVDHTYALIARLMAAESCLKAGRE